jgi:hypothetical protein
MLAIQRRERRPVALHWADVSWKVQFLWLALLLFAQLGDVWTTAFGITHGTVEGNLLVAATLDKGGITLFSILKVLVAIAMGLAVVLVRRFARYYPGRRAVFMQQMALRGTQLGAVALLLVSLNNLAVTGLLPVFPAS